MQSIYGNNGTFPSTQQVENGGFYVSDDDSTLVYQVYTNDDSPVLGQVEEKDGSLMITLQGRGHVKLVDHSVNPAQTVEGTVDIRFAPAIPVEGKALSGIETETFNILLQNKLGKMTSGILFDILDKTNISEQYMIHWGVGLDSVSTFVTLMVCGGYVYIQYNDQIYQTSLVLVTVANKPLFDTGRGEDNPHLIKL